MGTAVVGFVCRACDAREATLILDLGQLPLANAFVKGPGDVGDVGRWPVALVMCAACQLLQLRENAPRELLFATYPWVTGTSSTTQAHATWFAARLRGRVPAKPSAFLVEVASNDGFFLAHYREAGFEVLGVDPSDLAAEADQRGLPSIRDFFGMRIAERIVREHGPADVIVARNVLGHASELQDLAAGIRHLLAPGGVFVLEVPYAYFLRQEVQYDTVFHEHVSYYTIGSVARLMRRFALKIIDVSFVQMNGGSMLCELVHEDFARPRADQGFVDFEALIGLNAPGGWRGFADAVAAQRTAFVCLLEEMAGRGKTVVGYGAAAKCMTMLNYCGVSTSLLAAMGDANPRKQGLFCPGVRIPVVSPDELMRHRPDYIMIGAWNVKDEIMRFFREKMGYRNGFVVPLPMPVVVE